MTERKMIFRGSLVEPPEYDDCPVCEAVEDCDCEEMEPDYENYENWKPREWSPGGKRWL